MKKNLLLLCFLLINFSINTMQKLQNNHIREFITASDLHTIRITYNLKTQMIYATFIIPYKVDGIYDSENTYVNKNIKTKEFSSRATGLYIPACGSPFYRPKPSDSVLVNILKNKIDEFEKDILGKE